MGTNIDTSYRGRHNKTDQLQKKWLFQIQRQFEIQKQKVKTEKELQIENKFQGILGRKRFRTERELDMQKLRHRELDKQLQADSYIHNYRQTVINRHIETNIVINKQIYNMQTELQEGRKLQKEGYGISKRNQLRNNKERYQNIKYKTKIELKKI